MLRNLFIELVLIPMVKVKFVNGEITLKERNKMIDDLFKSMEGMEEEDEEE